MRRGRLCSRPIAWAASPLRIGLKRSRQLAQKVKGALLVAPADVDRKTLLSHSKILVRSPKRPCHFLPQWWPAGMILISSVDRAERYCACVGQPVRGYRPAGHVNGDSGLGDWPEGKRLLRLLAEGE